MSGKMREEISYGIVTVLSLMIFLMVMSLFTGKGWLEHNTYNTYALQADSWRQGRLDLGQNYSWLELVDLNGKIYASFPPFPSYVLFPFTFFCGSNTPDAAILVLLNILAVTFLYKLALKFEQSPQVAMFEALFATICSNMIFVMIDPSVWFFAQAMCFSLEVMAIYFAVTGKGGLALALWACAVGCRPMQALYLPVLLVILFFKEREKQPEEKWYRLFLNKWKWGIAPFVIAVSYMVLNYMRFGNIMEFGHNYLPEFLSYENGQFSLVYVKKNIKMLFNLPNLSDNGAIVIDHFGNFNFLIVNPVILLSLAAVLIMGIKKEYKKLYFSLLIIALSVSYLFTLVLHATMGGWHFGNRYTNDIIPWQYILLCVGLKQFPDLARWQIPFAILGLCVNVVGTVVVYNGL